MEHAADGEADAIRAIKELVNTQFRSLAWTPGADADWRLFADGFLPGAMLFPAARPVKPQSVEQFIDRMRRLRAEGKLASFEETPLGCAVRVFGNVAVVFAGCEMLENGSTVTRDVSAMVLVRDNGAWRIVAQAWDVENESQKIPSDLRAARAGEGQIEPLVSIRGIDHVVLRVKDIEAMRRFYCDVLGAEHVAYRPKFGMSHLRIGSAMLDLVEVEGPLGKQGGAAPGREGRNMDHLCFRVGPFNQDAIVAHLKRHGVAVGDIRPRFGAEGSGVSIYLTDPEGNTVELKGPSDGNRLPPSDS
jgi:glyoxylase I family protein